MSTCEHDDFHQFLDQIHTSLIGDAKKTNSGFTKDFFNTLFLNVKSRDALLEMKYFENPSLRGFGQWKRSAHQLDPTTTKWPEF